MGNHSLINSSVHALTQNLMTNHVSAVWSLNTSLVQIHQITKHSTLLIAHLCKCGEGMSFQDKKNLIYTNVGK